MRHIIQNPGDTATYGVAASQYAGVSLAPMFASERYSVQGPSFAYSLQVPTSTGFVVRLWFAESWPGAMKSGGRVFNVKVAGKDCLLNFDIFTAAGGGLKGISRDCAVAAGSATPIAVEFVRIGAHGDPKVSRSLY